MIKKESRKRRIRTVRKTAHRVNTRNLVSFARGGCRA